MRTFLFFAALLGMTFGITDFEYAEQAGITIDEAMELVGGILTGLNVKSEIEHLKDCFDKTPPLIKAITEFIHEMKEINWKDLEKVFALIAKLFGTLKEIFELLAPCAKIGDDIKVIIEKIKKINFENLMKKVMEKIWEIFTTVTDIIKKFDKKDYAGAGQGIGELVHMLLLENEMAEDQLEADFLEFFKGFFKGLGAESEYEKIIKCAKDVEGIIVRIVEAVKLIITLDIKKVIEGVTKLIAAVTDLLKMLQPCLEGTVILKKLIEKIMHVNIMALVWKVIGHIGELMGDINKIIEGFKTHNLFAIGEGLGAILKILFLD